MSGYCPLRAFEILSADDMNSSLATELIGRMDRLIDVVHDRFANRFYDGEREWFSRAGTRIELC